MSHVYHESLPDFDPTHVLHDGCPECERRTDIDGLTSLDGANLRRLWSKMIVLDIDAVPPPMSHADGQAMRTLYTIGVLMERMGILGRDFEERVPALSSHGSSDE